MAAALIADIGCVSAREYYFFKAMTAWILAITKDCW